MTSAPAAEILAQLEAIGLHLRADGGNLVASPREALTDDLRALIRAHKAELLRELEGGSGEPLEPSPAEKRKASAQAFLEAHPNVRRACFVDTESDPERVILTIALREPWAAVEMAVSRERFDPFNLIELSTKHPNTSVVPLEN